VKNTKFSCLFKLLVYIFTLVLSTLSQCCLMKDQVRSKNVASPVRLPATRPVHRPPPSSHHVASPVRLPATRPVHRPPPSGHHVASPVRLPATWPVHRPPPSGNQSCSCYRDAIYFCDNNLKINGTQQFGVLFNVHNPYGVHNRWQC
jgi:hypothetical protein